MRLYVTLILALGLLAFSGCKKNESTPETLEAYIKRLGITDAVKDDRGFYYKIITEGTGVNPTVSNNVTIFYKGMFTNGNIFDQTEANPATFLLGNLILGWKLGLPLIKPGGSIILYLPPSLAYGDNPDPRSGIPPNSVLIFEIKLVSVQ